LVTTSFFAAGARNVQRNDQRHLVDQSNGIVVNAEAKLINQQTSVVVSTGFGPMGLYLADDGNLHCGYHGAGIPKER
jgi:hypothetical protein